MYTLKVGWQTFEDLTWYELIDALSEVVNPHQWPEITHTILNNCYTDLVEVGITITNHEIRDRESAEEEEYA